MSKERIRALNDEFRNSFIGGRVMMTGGVNALPDTIKGEIVRQVRTFNTFDLANDPFEEHDFGSVEIDGQNYLWKIDYYDPSIASASDDPADAQKTTRVLTIMRADEY